MISAGIEFAESMAYKGSCSDCAAREGKLVPVTAEFPPFHRGCRCCMLAHIPDDLDGNPEVELPNDALGILVDAVTEPPPQRPWYRRWF